MDLTGLVELVVLGLVVGLVLGGLGGGGAILTVPVLVFVIGQSPGMATASSLVIVGLAAVVGVLGAARNGGVSWRTGLGLGAAGLPAAWLGSRLNPLVDGNLLLVGFAVIMLAAAVGMFRSQRDHAPSARQRSRLASVAAVLGSGLAVGFVTGFFGVGGGFVVVPALVVVLGLPMDLAVGTSLVVVALNAGVALLARIGTTHLDWAVVVPFALAAMAATLLGRRVADRLPSVRLRQAFGVLLVLVAAYTLVQSVPALL